MEVITPLEYIRLGKTNLLISRVAFGAMRLTDSVGDDNAAAIVRKAYDAGINFFDTSRKYPESEKLLGDALYDIRKCISFYNNICKKLGRAHKKS